MFLKVKHNKTANRFKNCNKFYDWSDGQTDRLNKQNNATNNSTVRFEPVYHEGTAYVLEIFLERKRKEKKRQFERPHITFERLTMHLAYCS